MSVASVYAQAKENVTKRNPELADYDERNSVVDAMIPTAIVVVLMVVGSASTGGNTESPMFLVIGFLVWVVRWGYIEIQKRKFSKLFYEEISKLEGIAKKKEDGSI